MKKLIIVFLCVISIFSYYISYKQFENIEWKKISEPINFTDFQFTITNDSLLSDPETIYPIIQKTAEELNVNIFRDTILYTEGNAIESNYYVLLTTDTKLFRKLDIIQGRYLSWKETESGEFFLSSKTTGNENQIGTINVFGKKNSLTIKPLIKSYSQISVAGEYYVEGIKQKESTVFYNTLARNFNDAFNPETPFTADYFISKENNEPYFPTDTDTLFLIKQILACVIALMVFYYILHRGKVIAIHKMHGIKNIEIWFTSIGKLLLIIFLATLIATIVFSLLQEGYNIQFIIEITVQHIETFIVITALSIIALFYILTVKISSILKNRKDTRLLFVINLLLKVGLFISSIFMMITILEQLDLIDEKEKLLTNWKESSDYGVFYPFHIGLDEEDLNQDNGSQTFDAVSKLYELLNQNGSLLINTKFYEQQTLGLPFEGIRYISVNPNYLEKFTILSEDNEILHVEESIQNQLLLVPSKYKEKEQEILNFFNQAHFDNVVYEEDTLRVKVPEYLSKPNYKIIWMKDQQKIFSFNPEVFPTEENLILDPIIQVITENNSLSADKHVILGGGAKDPLKVKLINQDPSLTLEQLKSSLQELQLDDNLKYLITIDHLIFKELSDLKQERLLNMLVLISLISGIIFILVQNTILMYYNYQKLFTVHSLFGTSFFKTYQNILYTFFGTWLVQFIILLLIDSKSTKLTLIILMLLLIEFMLTITTITILEQRNKVRILKGGI